MNRAGYSALSSVENEEICFVYNKRRQWMMSSGIKLSRFVVGALHALSSRDMEWRNRYFFQNNKIKQHREMLIDFAGSVVM